MWGEDGEGYQTEFEPGLRRLAERLREQSSEAANEAERGVRPGRYCLPSHRLPCNSVHEASQRVGCRGKQYLR
jgi:hypothetical protein